jgi:DNA-binding CsgD family transcriptional regulator
MSISADVTADLALCIADDPDPKNLARHLAQVTFAHLNPMVITIYMRVETSEGEGLVLVGQHGLTDDETTRYTHMRPDFPLPATEAVQHTLPFTHTMAEMAELFPVLRIRPELAGEASQLNFPIAIAGVTVGAVLVTLEEPFTWDPTSWHTALAIQAVLGLYVRTTDRFWAPLRPRNPEFAVIQGLSKRQVAILTLVDQGRSTSAIGARLGFSQSTIKQDLRRAMISLEVTDRRQAVQRARELGLLNGE